MRVLPLPCLADNYAYLVIDDRERVAALVDPSTLEGVEKAVRELSNEGITLREVWATHHHGDHVGGVDDVCRVLGVREVVGFGPDADRIPRITRKLEDGETFMLGSIRVRALAVPGHTLGALAYVCEPEKEPPCVFTGDTLFVAGCGRIFEGTPAVMYASLTRLAELPAATQVYCGHEYTVANLVFAAHLEPNSRAIAERLERSREMRARGLPTVPSTIAQEHATNPFFRAASPELRGTLGLMVATPDVDVFAAARKAKDGFVAKPAATN